MRAVVSTVLLLIAAMAFPRSALAEECYDDLTACYSRTILFSSPEDYDLVACQAEYLECFLRLVRAS